jgi:hypothetical protein
VEDDPLALPLSSPEPRSKTWRDVGVLVVLVGVLGVVLDARAGAVYAIPVTFGHDPIVNVHEIVAVAEEQFDQLVGSSGGRVARGARCYFYRPLGPTGAIPGELLPAEMLGIFGEGVDGFDVMVCGPVELAGASSGSSPWVGGIVAYRSSGDGSFRGEFQTLLPAQFGAVQAMGGVRSDHLLTADGLQPDGDVVTAAVWRDVAPTGEPPPTPGLGPEPPVSLPPGVTLPLGVTLPTEGEG